MVEIIGITILVLPFPSSLLRILTPWTRVLQYENIMFEDNSKTANIKVIDFGLSKKFLGKPGTMTERCGTM